MNIRLVEHLQKLAEEDLFPEASEEEVNRRKEEQKGRWLKRLEGFNVGDKVAVKKGVHLNLRLEREGQDGEITKLEPGNPQLIPYPIKVRFPDPETQWRYSVDWFAPEELEKVK